MKKIRSKKIISSLAISTLVLGLFITTVINANETEEITEPEIQEVEETRNDEVLEEKEETSKEETVSNDVSVVTFSFETEQIYSSDLTRVDLSARAFPDSSRPLELAIIANYTIDGIDGSTPDGYISIGEANAFNEINYSGDTAISLAYQGLTGTIDGIEHFIQTERFYLNNNSFTGSIPTNIGSASNLKVIYFHNNQLTGNIPTSICDLTNLVSLFLGGNQLTGDIPADIGNLNKLGQFYAQGNQLTGVIPTSIGAMTALKELALYDNQLTGSIPQNIGNLPNIEIMLLNNNQLSGILPSSLSNLSTLCRFAVNNNIDLSGTVADLFNGHTNLILLNIRGTQIEVQKPQTVSSLVFLYNALNLNKDNVRDGFDYTSLDDLKDELEAYETVFGGMGTYYTKVIDELEQELLVTEEILAVNPVVDALFNSDKTDLADNITLTEIEDAESVANAMSESAAKDRLLSEIELAKDMLKAKEAVDELFTSKAHVDIIEDLTQSNIDDAQKAVDKLPSGDLKGELQKEIDKAQEMLDAKNKVEDLFTDGTHTDILDDLTQTDINEAQKAVDKLQNGDLKDELQKEIDKAQDMLDAKNKVDNLFKDDTHTNITDGLTQKDIDKAQDAVDKLPNVTLKDELQKEIDKAQDMLNARDAANDLLDKDGNLNSGVTQKEIDKAQDLVNKLPDGGLKNELQAIIDEAQKQLDAQNKKNPSTAPTVDASSSVGGKSVNTSDATNLSLYGGLLLLSLGGLVVFMKKREME